MKKIWMITVVSVSLLVSSGAWAAYTIDASLADWGVTKHVDWVPDSPTASYNETDDQNQYNATAFSESYDMEALYFDSDKDNLYFAVVSSFTDHLFWGDLGFDLNGDFGVNALGIVTGLEYAIQVGTSMPGALGLYAPNVLQNPTWSNTTVNPNLQNSPYQASGGTVLGAATAAAHYYGSDEAVTYLGQDPNSTMVVEAAFARDILPDAVEWELYLNGGMIGIHITMDCGNDGINLKGPIPPIPAPGAVVLASVGAGLVGWLRRKRTL